ncbi:MAG: pyridoxal-phosphate dependent enzyme [Anaerolineae bacterium]|nr:pyridoxal-phosphate dependent enzyme [Anaerolineae bacterium]
MSTLFNAVRCLECGHMMAPDPYAFQCEACGSSWMDAVYACETLPANWPDIVNTRPASMWRYTELMPFADDFQILSIGEGWTPLIRAAALQQESGCTALWIKDERRQPTGSFKDRQAAVAVSALRAQGIKEVVLASTGNAAAAYAAYCARAGIKLWVFLTSSVPAEKMRELALYGAEVVKITGTYDQAKKVAADFAARHGFPVSRGAKSIPCKESMKTIAFEIVEQLGWRAPDWYIQAVSGGIGPLGVHKGFLELYTAGLIDRVPKIGVVQTEGCAPMVRAWEQGREEAEPVRPDSLITVLATGSPGLAYKILNQANAQYGGAMVSVTDGEAFRAMRRVARLEGLSMEPAASVAFAGFEKLLERGYIQPDASVIINCSGHTFSAEKHALEDRYTIRLEASLDSLEARPVEGLAAALEQLDEQITTLVIIDDNPHDNRLIRRLLQSYKSYRVFEAYTGRDGLDLVRQRQPELIVLDLTLPDMDGFSVMAELKMDARTREIPVVVISAKSLSSNEHDYLRQYTDSVWLKGSFSARELVKHVAEVLGDDAEELRHLVASPDARQDDQLLSDFGQQKRSRILVIEDNVWEARLMRRLLESRPTFEVLETYSAGEALAILEDRMPDLIILDLLLPDTAGEQFLARLRSDERTRQIPVLVVTGKELEPAARIQLSSQVDSIWSKLSLDRNMLLAYVENLLAE